MVQVGDTLGPYEVVEQIGVGGMATVYKAYHAKLDRDVAVKVLHQSLTPEPNFLARFQREAQIIARLEHPNIVTVYDYSDIEGSPYLVMRFVEGRTLEQILQDGPLALPEIMRIMHAVGDALAYAHEHGVLHRDVKPSNIIIDARGVPYLTDFGLARLVRGGSSTLSQGTIIGTPHYISPEQGLGQSELDARTDVYSFGVVLYELVVGRVPYTGDTPFSVVHDHIYTPLPLPREVNPDVPPQVESVLVKALAKDPASRYQTVTDLVQAFEAVVNAAGPDRVRPARAAVPSEPQPTVDTEPMEAEAVRARPSRGRPQPPAPPFGPGSRRRRDRAEFQLDLGNREDWEDLGEKLGSKVEEFAAKIENWAEQFDDGQGGTSRRRRGKAPLTPEEEIRRRVEKRIKARQELMQHFVAYVLVNALLWVIWGASGSWFGGIFTIPWPLIVMLGWGIGLIAHLMEYNNKYGAGAARKEREIQRELERARARGELPVVDSVAEDLGALPSKRKNEDLGERRVRLSDDGELTDSFAEDMDSLEKPKRSRRR
jgi:serine/threonine protein kinase